MKIQPEWIEWKGGEMPVHTDTLVAYELRNGRRGISTAGILSWRHHGVDYDVVAYAIDIDIEPYKPQPKWTVGKDGGGGWILYCGNAYLYLGLHRESNAHRLVDALNAAGVEI